MNKEKQNNTLDNDFPIGKITQIEDFLPSPAEIAESIRTESSTD